MLGQNPKRAPEITDGNILKVQNIFLTFQGEGPYTGFPAVFIRLGGCNLACSFCDTEFESFYEISVDDIIKKVKELTESTNCSLVIITGGEPFRQSINLLCKTLLKNNFIVQIETNGTLYQEIDDHVEVVCSPKLSSDKYYPIREDLKKHIVAYKFLISKNLAGYQQVPDWDFEGKRVYVQPIDEYDADKNQQNNKLAMEIAMKKGYIFSVQIHKIIGIE